MLSVLVFVVSVALSVLKFLIFFGFGILVDAIQFVGGLLLFLVNVSMDMDTVIFVCWAGVQSWFDFVICNLQLQVPVAVDLKGVRKEVEREKFVSDFSGNCEKTKKKKEWASHKEIETRRCLPLLNDNNASKSFTKTLTRGAVAHEDGSDKIGQRNGALHCGGDFLVHYLE